jgi:hypothetical protein
LLLLSKGNLDIKRFKEGAAANQPLLFDGTLAAQALSFLQQFTSV